MTTNEDTTPEVLVQPGGLLQVSEESRIPPDSNGVGDNRQGSAVGSGVAATVSVEDERFPPVKTAPPVKMAPPVKVEQPAQPTQEAKQAQPTQEAKQAQPACFAFGARANADVPLIGPWTHDKDTWSAWFCNNFTRPSSAFRIRNYSGSRIVVAVGMVQKQALNTERNINFSLTASPKASGTGSIETAYKWMYGDFPPAEYAIGAAFWKGDNAGQLQQALTVGITPVELVIPLHGGCNSACVTIYKEGDPLKVWVVGAPVRQWQAASVAGEPFNHAFAYKASTVGAASPGVMRMALNPDESAAKNDVIFVSGLNLKNLTSVPE